MPPRLLEISHQAFVKEAWPDATHYINTTFYTEASRTAAGKLRGLALQFRNLWRTLREPHYDAVFCRCLGRFIYRRDLSFPVNALRLIMSWFVTACVWAQTARGARLAVIDELDEITLDGRDLFLLRRCYRYFKRELPQNAWNLFLRVQPQHGEFYDLTQRPDLVAQLDKFEPISIGITATKIQRIDEVIRSLPPGGKDIDVFYAGPVSHSTVRTAGVPQLEELGRQGYRVEIHVGHLPFETFVEKMHRAWLVWSPEGQGWECYRHYEVCMAGTVPVMNQAGIRRHEPLRDGVHCVQYAVEGDDLRRQVERALADRSKLQEMAAAGREHVLQFHTYAKLGTHIIRQTLGIETADTSANLQAEMQP